MGHFDAGRSHFAVDLASELHAHTLQVTHLHCLWEVSAISQVLHEGYAGGHGRSWGSLALQRPEAQAYYLLRVGFAALPIIAGLDKFLHFLVNWDQYLAPSVAAMLPLDGHTFMLIVGVIEIAAGLLVAVMPSIGSYIVMLWLWGIVANLLMVSGYYDIALRDFGLSLGALALGRLSQDFPDLPRRDLIHR